MKGLDAFMQLYAEALLSCVTADRARPESERVYFYGPEGVSLVVAKMREAFANDSYNLDGPAIRKACRKLGIRPTRKAIRAYLETGAP